MYLSITIQTDFGVCILFYQRSDPFKSRKCERGDCPVCREDGKGPCDRQSVTYNIKCAECNDIYIGETSSSAYTRGKEHIKSLAKKEERSALWKHCKEKHDSEMQKFEMNVTGSRGHPTTIFGKLSVRKTIRGLEFSDHFLTNFLLACFS